jgi:hypothetical protein
VSGQIGLDPKVSLECYGLSVIIRVHQTGDFVSTEVVGQAEQTLKNLGAILEAAGTTEQNGDFNLYQVSRFFNKGVLRGPDPVTAALPYLNSYISGTSDSEPSDEQITSHQQTY